ncbi:hypothetical protein FSP39_005188 [Pinctada imbricata]|uniref:PX domain-containing protein n=1 Tax=Pinctada imbricata TaxID=66713 RepID=A0AA88YB72_PINIB|nr:hypothetical protein FSP39_005188 [Pinctada imbricata]
MLRTSDELFISTMKPHKGVSRDTISRWIKTILCLSGINIAVFTAHSTRAASTSAANKAGVPLKDILKYAGCIRDVLNRDNPTYLYPFMQFLKNEASINVLQFNLACEDFNTRILSPELSQGELVELHNMAKDLYKTYCSHTAQDRIKFDEKIIEELQEIVEGPPDQVLRLRTSTPLFKAYDHTYNLLENTFLPLFHQSDPFYTMLCGSRDPTSITKSSSRQPEKKSFGFSNIGHKLKGVFKSGDMRSLPEGENFEDADRLTIASCSSLDDEVSESLELELPDFTVDLSTWRVCIPRVGARPEPDNMKKQFLVFIIDVRRVGMTSSTQINGTRYNEFYVLESKLAEFHGDLLLDCQLPPKKIVGTGKQEFIEGKKELFEQYLQKLLTKPFLKGSQLLFSFLTTEEQFTSSFLPDINLGKMFKSGAMKLVKEKGKHLETFLQTFEQSTISPPPRSSKSERRGSDVSLKSTSSEKLCGGLYENNANCSTDSFNSNASSSSYDCVNVASEPQDQCQEIEGAYDIFVYIARYVYSVPDWFHHILMTGRILAKSTIENYLEWFIEQKIDQVSQEHRVVRLVHLLRVLIYCRTDEEKRERFQKTLQGSLDFIPKPFVSVVGRSNHENGTKLLLEVLQQPKLNKQCRNFLQADPSKEVLLDVSSTSSDSSDDQFISPLTRLGQGNVSRSLDQRMKFR